MERAPVISVVLADDHELVRAGLRALLVRDPDIEVVAEASDGRKAVEVIAALLPDVAVIDIGLPGLNGIDVIAKLRHDELPTAVLVLSVLSEKEYVVRAFREGATGYLVKDSAEGELAVAIRAVAAGRRYVSPRVAGPLIDEIANAPHPPNDPFEVLTPRQREILQLVAEGLSTRDIARFLSIGAKTVETHRRDIMRRLDIHSVAGLTKYAIRNRLTPPR